MASNGFSRVVDKEVDRMGESESEREYESEEASVKSVELSTSAELEHFEEGSPSVLPEGGPQEKIISRRDKVRGFSCVCIAAFIWVVSSYWVKDLEKNGMTPFLVTSVANSMFTVLLPFAYLKDSPLVSRCSSWFSKRMSGQRDEGEALIGNKQNSSSSSKHQDSKSKESVSRKKVFLLSLCMWPIWFTCLYIYNWSFLLTSVMSNTILSIGGTSFFTYMMELKIMKAKFSVAKLVAILLCISGTVLWTYGTYNTTGSEEEEQKKKESGKYALLGNVLCIISSALYSVVSIIIGKYLPEEGESEMSLFWGYTGAINLGVTVPINIILGLTGVNEMFDLPAEMFGQVMLKGLMDNLLSNYLWAYAVLFIGPTSANVGMSIETPMVLVFDAVSKNTRSYTNIGAVVGAVLIMFGFFGLTF